MSKQNELFGFTDASEATGKPVRRRRRNSLAGKPQLTPSSAVLTRLVETSHEIATSPDPLPALGACGCKSTMSISVPAPGADPVRGFGSCPLPGSHRAGTRGRATVTTALARRGKAKGRDSISVACFSFGPHAEMRGRCLPTALAQGHDVGSRDDREQRVGDLRRLLSPRFGRRLRGLAPCAQLAVGFAWLRVERPLWRRALAERSARHIDQISVEHYGGVFCRGSPQCRPWTVWRTVQAVRNFFASFLRGSIKICGVKRPDRPPSERGAVRSRSAFGRSAVDIGYVDPTDFDASANIGY